MDAKLLLVKAVTLLFRESQIADYGSGSDDLVRETLNSIKLPESVIETDHGREVLTGLRATVLWLIDRKAERSVDKEALLQRIRVNVGDETWLFDAIEQGIRDIDDQEKIRDEALSHRRDLIHYHRNNAVTNLVRSASSTLMFNAGSIDWRTYVQDLMDKLEPYRSDATAVIEQDDNDLTFDDITKIAGAVERAKEENQTDGVMVVGYQGFMRMLGHHKGLRRGDMSLVGALQHKFKSGWCNAVFATACMFNTPYLKDKTKKPMMMLISTEDKVSDKLLWMFKFIKENLEGVKVDSTQYTSAEIAEYTIGKLTQMGYEINMVRVNPSDFSYASLQDRINRFEAMGYEIHLLVIDYLAMFNKTGCTHGATGAEIKDLIRRVRNLGSAKGIHIMTPHQLSSDAKQKLRDGISESDFVKEVANLGYWDGCKGIDQEVDLEYYIHIVKVDGRSYLTFQRGKHRGLIDQTDDRDMYFALPFQKVGTLLWDFNGKDTTLRKPGGGAIGTSEEMPWFDSFEMSSIAA